MLFFIREYGKNGNRNKMTSYNKKNITIDIDQDPINQLVFDASNQLQSSSPMGHQSFKLLISTYVSSITNRAYSSFKKLFTCNRYSETNPFLIFYRVIYRRNEEVECTIRSLGSINTINASRPLRGSNGEYFWYFLCIDWFSLSYWATWENLLTLRLFLIFVITLLTVVISSFDLK